MCLLVLKNLFKMVSCLKFKFVSVEIRGDCAFNLFSYLPKIFIFVLRDTHTLASKFPGIHLYNLEEFAGIIYRNGYCE